MAQTASERQRSYRAREKALGYPPRRGKRTKSGKSPSNFVRGEFVAIDGEGVSEGAVREWEVGENNRLYRGQDHFYTLLTASDGSEIFAEQGRLSTADCLDFLLDAADNTPHAILVCYGASYDMVQMLAHGLERDDLETLVKGVGQFSPKYVDVTLGEYDYRIEMRPRKSLSVWRWNAGEEKYIESRTKDGTRRWKLTPCRKAVLWDVIGFFQCSFVEAMQTWVPDHADYEFIKRMKGERNIFTRAETPQVRLYNAAELRCLVAIMNGLREAIARMNVIVTRWDGAGAIAAAVLKMVDIKAHMSVCPPEVFDAACHAFSGGHIEMVKLGRHNGAIYHYDVNSAYPNQLRKLPSLANGTWSHGHGAPPDGFTLVRVKYHFPLNLPFYPLFFREERGNILYPSYGEGWYWLAEYQAAKAFAEKFGALHFEVVEWHHLTPQFDIKPFAWIETFFERRKALVEESKRTGIPNGEEKTLKLSYNSCYGKLAQQVGARLVAGEIVPPPFFQIEWAGFVTAGCRAQLMEAALENPRSIIGFATDGLFSIEPLSVYAPAEKILGAWEFQKHDGMTMVMPGVYWLHDGQKTKHYSRGFDKKDMKTDAPVLAAWAKKQSFLDVTMRRMITLGSALMSEAFWEMRGMFVDTVRSLKINGDNSKRVSPSFSKTKPSSAMLPTHAREPWHGLIEWEEGLLSDIYPISWENEESIADPENGPALQDDVLAAFYA